MERKVAGIPKGAGLLAGLGDAKKKKISSSLSFLCQLSRRLPGTDFESP